MFHLLRYLAFASSVHPLRDFKIQYGTETKEKEEAEEKFEYDAGTNAIKHIIILELH